MGNELYHHGVLGMKWGVRRYQNKDGTLTAAGKKRYLNEDDKPKDNTPNGKPNTPVSKKPNQTSSESDNPGTKPKPKRKPQKPTTFDYQWYGEAGAARIALDCKSGMTLEQARKKEDKYRSRMAALKRYGTMAATGSLQQGVGVMRAATNLGRSYINDYKNISVTDTNGNVVASWHEKVNVGRSFVGY